MEPWLSRVCLRQPEGGGLSRSLKVTSAWLEAIVQDSDSPVAPPGSEWPLLQGPANLPVIAHVSSGWNWATTAGWLGWGGFLNHWDDADTSRTRKKRRLFSLLPSPVIGVRCCQFTLLNIHCAGIFGFVLSVIFKQTTKYLLCKIQKLVRGW